MATFQIGAVILTLMQLMWLHLLEIQIVLCACMVILQMDSQLDFLFYTGWHSIKRPYQEVVYVLFNISVHSNLTWVSTTSYHSNG